MSSPFTKKLPYKDLPKSMLLESLGTLALVVLAASTAIGSYLLKGMDPFKEHALIAVTVAIVVGLSTLLFGSVSGAHINPSVSLAHAISGVIPRRMLVPFFGGQIAAAVVSAAVLRVAFGSINSPTHFGLTKIQEGATPTTGLLLEIIGTFVLSCVALYSSMSLKGKPEKQAILSGVTIFVLTVLIGPFTGASFNPSRSLGPALASGIFENQVVYWVGPLTGAALAGSVFLLLENKRAKKKKAIMDIPEEIKL